MADDPISLVELKRLKEIRKGKPLTKVLEQRKWRDPLECTEFEAAEIRRFQVNQRRMWRDE